MQHADAPPALVSALGPLLSWRLRRTRCERNIPDLNCQQNKGIVEGSSISAPRNWKQIVTPILKRSGARIAALTSVLWPCFAYGYVWCLQVQLEIRPSVLGTAQLQSKGMVPSSKYLQSKWKITHSSWVLYIGQGNRWKRGHGRDYCPGILQECLSVLIDTDFVLVSTQQSDLEGAVWISLSCKVRLIEIA